MYGPEDTKEEMQVESGHNSHVYKTAVRLKKLYECNGVQLKKSVS